MKRSIKLFLTSLLCLSFVGCTTQPGGDKDNPPICGGVTDYTDINAPKEIASKNIVRFSTSFFIHDEYDESKSGNYYISIKDNEKGEHIFTIWGAYKHDMVVGDQVLADVQAIIDKYQLVKNNGAGRVTAGLPPEYGPWSLNVIYDSGEKLFFSENGVPYADWTAAFRDYFVGLMADAGFEDALPPKEAVTIEKFSFAFDIDGYYHCYCIGKYDGNTCFWHRSHNMDTMADNRNEFAVITDALYEGLQEVIMANGIDSLNAPRAEFFKLKSSKDGFLEIHVHYVSGRQITGEYGPSELPEEWPKMKAALVEYMDNYIKNNPAKVD